MIVLKMYKIKNKILNIMEIVLKQINLNFVVLINYILNMKNL